MMSYSLLCTDLDGTLLTTKDNVSDRTVEAIAKIKNQLQVILVSARMPQGMTYIQERLGIGHEPMICYNGALILHGEKELFSQTIPLELVKQLYQMAQPLDIQLGLYSGFEWYVEQDSERVQKEVRYTHTQTVFRPTTDTLQDWEQRNIGAHKIMLMCTKETADQLAPMVQEHLEEALHFYRSNDTLIEVSPKSVSKIDSIRKLLPHGKTLENVIAFGDNYNDIEMLDQVGLGVAVANAKEPVKQVAKAVTLANTEDGVAHYLSQMGHL